MKKLTALCVFALCVSAPSFAAEDVLSHSVNLAGKDTYKAAKVTAVDTAKATKAVVKFVF